MAHPRALLFRLAKSTPLQKRCFSQVQPTANTKHAWFNQLHCKARQLLEPRYVVHFGNLLAVCAMFQTDMLYLRSFMIGASGCGIMFNLLQPKPLITPATWGVFFMIGHSIQIYFLIRDQLSVVMSSDLDIVYRNAFSNAGFTARQFLDLCKYCNASFVTFQKGEYITSEGGDMPYIHWLFDGRVRVKSERHAINSTANSDGPSNRWLGEFFDPNRERNYWQKPHKWMVDYRCLTDCKALRLDRQRLDEFLNQSDSLKEKASKIIVKDIWGKLRSSRDAVRYHSYDHMLNVALLSYTKEHGLSEKMKKYLQQYAQDHRIEPEHIDSCLKEQHGLSYAQVFASCVTEEQTERADTEHLTATSDKIIQTK